MHSTVSNNTIYSAKNPTRLTHIRMSTGAPLFIDRWIIYSMEPFNIRYTDILLSHELRLKHRFVYLYNNNSTCTRIHRYTHHLSSVLHYLACTFHLPLPSMNMLKKSVQVPVNFPNEELDL